MADKAARLREVSIAVYESLAGRIGYGPLEPLPGDADRDVTEVASPLGVVFATVPATTAVETALSSTLNKEDLLRKVWEELRRLFDVENFYIASLNPVRDEMHFELEIIDGVRLPRRSRPAGNGRWSVRRIRRSASRSTH